MWGPGVFLHGPGLSCIGKRLLELTHTGVNPCHASMWYLHGAQGHQLHKGVCSDFVDPVVLEATEKKQKLVWENSWRQRSYFMGIFVPLQQKQTITVEVICVWKVCSYFKGQRAGTKQLKAILSHGQLQGPDNLFFWGHSGIWCTLVNGSPLSPKPHWFPALLHPVPASSRAKEDGLEPTSQQTQPRVTFRKENIFFFSKFLKIVISLTCRNVTFCKGQQPLLRTLPRAFVG